MSNETKPIRVLLVDDHKALLWGLSRLIDGQMPRMQVVGQADTRDEAVRQAEYLVPDLVLLDLDLGGEAAVEILPALVANVTTRVLVFTGVRDTHLLDQAVSRGARGIVRKNVEAEVLLKAIEKVHAGELWLDGETLTRVFFEMMTPPTSRKLDPKEKLRATLTIRERKVITAVLEGTGAPNKVLAQTLFISEHTLRNHLTSIYEKLGLSNRLELYVWAVKHQYDY